MKVVINACFGGFGLSQAAYLKLHEYGVPIVRYVEEKRNPTTRLFESRDDGEVIYDRELTPPEENTFSALYWKYKGTRGNNRYWDSWTREHRTHPLVIRVVEELGSKAASGPLSELKVVEIPDGTEFTVEDYDGNEHVAEVHRAWS